MDHILDVTVPPKPPQPSFLIVPPTSLTGTRCTSWRVQSDGNGSDGVRDLGTSPGGPVHEVHDVVFVTYVQSCCSRRACAFSFQRRCRPLSWRSRHCGALVAAPCVVVDTGGMECRRTCRVLGSSSGVQLYPATLAPNDLVDRRKQAGPPKACNVLLILQ